MSTGANIYQMYGKCSSKERIDLIYTNYSQFEGIIKGCEAKLIYEIEAEQEYNRQSRKGDLGVRIQNIGHYSDKTANQAVVYVMLEQEVDLDELSDSAPVSRLTGLPNSLPRSVRITGIREMNSKEPRERSKR